MASASAPPLAGLKVLDLSRVLAGPYCTQQFADLGAEVIKVESFAGDETRRFGPPFVKGESTYYLAVNRGKRSIAVDLKQPRGRQVVHELARWADLCVANFRPGTDAKLGVDAATLHDLNPRLITIQISGFGQRGDPHSAALPGYDVVAQGLGGVASLTGPTDGAPHKVGTSVADLVAGLHAFGAGLAALYERERTGKGRSLDISLFDGQLALLTYHASAWLNAGVRPQRLGNAHPSICPYETFRSADGYFNLGCANDGLFVRLCDVIGRPELATDSRFATNAGRVAHRTELVALLEPIFAGAPSEQWTQRLTAAGIPAGPILEVPDALAHPQAQARGMIVERQHPTVGAVRAVGSAMGFPQGSYADGPPPRLGEHTRSILQEVLGYDDERVQELIDAKAVQALAESRR